MLKTMNKQELMNVNGGFYYICIRYYKTVWSGSYYYRKYVGMSIVQVASGSGLTDMTYLDGRRIY